MAYDLQEAMLAADSEVSDTSSALSTASSEDAREEEPFQETAEDQLQVQRDFIIRRIGSDAFSEAMSIVHQVGLDIMDISAVKVYFDHVINQDM
jgi:hypothetical protein